MKKDLRTYLEEIASRAVWNDAAGFSPFDYSGGNYDDAYYGGCDDGKVLLARELLKKFGG